MRTLGATVSAVAATAVVLLSPGAPAHAASHHARGPLHVTQAQLRAARHLSAGHYTRADILTVLANRAFANVVPDPNQKATWKFYTRPAAPLNRGLLGDGISKKSNGCPGNVQPEDTFAHYDRRSMLGALIYRWHNDNSFCYNTSTDTVVSWAFRDDYVSPAEAVVNMQERTVNDKSTGIPAYSRIVRHLQLCALGNVGCYANRYPWNLVNVYQVGGIPIFGQDGNDDS